MNDNELRALLNDSGAMPRSGDASALLDTLVDRIEAGGVDVALAPVPAIASVETAPVVPLAGRTRATASSGSRLGRASARAASIGVVGWIAIGTGAAVAAAATTSWLVRTVEPTPVPDPVPSAEPAPERLEDGDGDSNDDWVVAGAEDFSPIYASSQSTPEWSVPSPIVDEPRPADQGDAAPTNEPGPDSPRGDGSEPGAKNSESDLDSQGEQRSVSDADTHESRGEAGTQGSDASDSTAADGDVSIELDLGDVTAPVTDAVTDGVEAIEDELDDLVDSALPPGPIADTVAPVIGAVNVSGLVAWALDSLLCASQGSVSVAVTDNVGVAQVAVRVQTVGGLNATIPLAQSSAGQWTGILPTVSLLDLGSLGSAVTISVEATDSAGNSASAQRSVTLSLGSCLG